MYLKPKNNSNSTKALLYRRFISLESSKNLKNLYQTIDDKYWTFDYNLIDFVEFTDTVPTATNIVTITATTVLTYLTNYMYYTTEWVITDDFETTGYSLLSATYNNIGQYQMNKYYFSGSFDYMIKGDISGSTGQVMKGLITPISNFTIRMFNDDIILKTDDLVVINGKLYSIEDTSTSIKKPSQYTIFYATLNNIL
jgi:hypothetical protein